MLCVDCVTLAFTERLGNIRQTFKRVPGETTEEDSEGRYQGETRRVGRSGEDSVQDTN